MYVCMQIIVIDRVSSQNRKVFVFAVSVDFYTDWPSK